MGFFRSSKTAAKKELKKAKKDLQNTQPSEEAWTKYDLIDAGVEQAHLVGLQTQGDGIWICCKGHENTLVQYDGRFPFKYLQCGRCNHTLCKDCQTSDILVPYTEAMHHALGSSPSWNDRVCVVCSACGLTRRSLQDKKVLTFPTACQCGKDFSEALSLGFFLIGTADSFRRDPAGQAVNVKMRYIAAASKRTAEARYEGQRRTQ